MLGVFKISHNFITKAPSIIHPPPPPPVHVRLRGLYFRTALMGKLMWKKVCCAAAGLRVPPSGRVKKCKSCLSFYSPLFFPRGGRGTGVRRLAGGGLKSGGEVT